MIAWFNQSPWGNFIADVLSPNTCYYRSSWAVFSGELIKTCVKISQQWFKQWFCAVKYLAIAWSYVGPELGWSFSVIKPEYVNPWRPSDICISQQTTLYFLSPVRCQTNTWTIVHPLSNGHYGTKRHWNLRPNTVIFVQKSLRMLFVNCRSFCSYPGVF